MVDSKSVLLNSLAKVLEMLFGTRATSVSTSASLSKSSPNVGSLRLTQSYTGPLSVSVGHSCVPFLSTNTPSSGSKASPTDSSNSSPAKLLSPSKGATTAINFRRKLNQLKSSQARKEAVAEDVPSNMTALCGTKRSSLSRTQRSSLKRASSLTDLQPRAKLNVGLCVSEEDFNGLETRKDSLQTSCPHGRAPANAVGKAVKAPLLPVKRKPPFLFAKCKSPTMTHSSAKDRYKRWSSVVTTLQQKDSSASHQKRGPQYAEGTPVAASKDNEGFVKL